MKWFASLSIRNKIIIIIQAVSLIVVAVIGSARIIWDLQQDRKALVQELSAVMQLLGDRSSAALVFDDVRLAEKNLTSLKTIPHVIEACLYRIDNTLLAQYQRDSKLVTACVSVGELQDKLYWFDNERLNISSNIKENNITQGWIYLASDFSKIEKKKQEIFIFSLLALLAAVVISVLLANWAQRIISRPIIEITKIAQAIEQQGDHSLRVTFSGRDEIAQLARTFNSMLDALETKNEQLRRSQKMDALGKLTGGVAHDYNNMLGVVLGYADLLKATVDEDSKQAKYIQEMIHAGERGARLTKKLLAFSRKKSSDASEVNINTVLQDEQHMLEKTLTARISLNYSLNKNLWPVWLDSDDLEDAILNMCINAMHAMKDGGQLTIETCNETIGEADLYNFQLHAGDYVVLSITDSGCGMDQETLSNIFDPFYSTKGDKGTGLGLSQVYGFVVSSGGAIKVYSEVGKGTQFLLYFPRCQNHEVQQKHTETEHEDYSGNGESILVVDDELALCQMTTEILRENGYQVMHAESAKNALAILDTHTIDLLLTDVIMPEMDGYELAALVQKKYPSIKIQLASGFTDDRHMDMVDSHLHQQLIRKPYSSQTILRAIRKLLKE